MTDAVEQIITIQQQAMQTGTLTMWTIYDHPTDYPDVFVARCFDINADGAAPTEHVVSSHSLHTLRGYMRRSGLTCLTRNAEDEKQIVETWL